MSAVPHVMTLESQKEQFSKAYAIAVASVAGCGHYKPEPDDDSVDLGFSSRKDGTVQRKPRIEAQLKATARDLIRDDHIAFPLPLKNYDDLRQETHVPRILIVVVVPTAPANWLRQSEFKTHVYRCAYWVSLLGKPSVSNITNVVVRVPRVQLFSAQALNDMMDRVANGGKP